nr:hypothetical protein [Tanacetum cinerariifolium]GEW76032.1 hypothetical protein [Tanacetum cinerariifolium]
MSSSPSHATVTYTSISSDYDLPSWGIHLMDAYVSDLEAPEDAPQSPEQAPLSPVPSPVYPEYVAPADDDLPAEDHSLLTSTSPTALSPDYLADSELVKNDPKEDPDEGPIDYPSEEEEPYKEEEEEETLALALSVSSVLDSIPSSKDTKPFEEGEIATIPSSPVSPQTVVLLS